MPAIKITCKGQKYIPVEKLQTFQGNLKELRAPELEKLKRSILKHGFSFPVFVWGDFILDGHQRIFAVLELLRSGHTIGKIPVVEIEAADKTEAAEKLLILNSHYARITDEGLYEFLAEHSVDLAGIKDALELPDIDIEKFLAGWSGEPSKLDKNFNSAYGGLSDFESIEEDEDGKYPVTFILDKTTWDKWEAIKRNMNIKLDKVAFLKIIGEIKC